MKHSKSPISKLDDRHRDSRNKLILYIQTLINNLPSQQFHSLLDARVTSEI